MNTWERIGLLIGVIGGIISIPKGLIDGWQAIEQTFYAKPKLIIERSAPLSLTYDPKQKILTLSFGLILQNKGDDSEAIERCSGYLGVPGDATRRAAFDDTDIIFKDGGNQIPKNLPIQKGGEYRPITCEITSYFTDQLRAMFSQHETERELVLSLSGQNQRSYSVRFGFDFGDGIASTLFDPTLQAPKTLRILDSILK
jgi:hypothetical protein